MLRCRLLPLGLALLIVGLATGCSSTDGRTLPPPNALETTTTPSTPVIQTVPGGAFTLIGASFVGGQAIPAELSCQGSGLSPALSWTGTPTGTAELALVVRDRTADGFLHWVVTGIDPTVTGFGESGLPEGAAEAVNGAAVTGWSPPCPPAGDGVHFYEFALHALPGALGVLPGSAGSTTADLIEQASVTQATLIVTYSVE